jgi:hypothetical protein
MNETRPEIAEHLAYCERVGMTPAQAVKAVLPFMTWSEAAAILARAESASKRLYEGAQTWSR